MKEEKAAAAAADGDVFDGARGLITKDPRAPKAAEAFKAIDKSGDGKISMPEAKAALTAEFPELGKEVSKAFILADGDGDFYLDAHEWLQLHACLATFSKVDRNGDGQVSLMEAKRAFTEEFKDLNIKEVPSSFFLAADESGDFYFSLQELIGLRASLAAYADADQSGDGKVSMPEAKKIFLSKFSEKKAKTVTAFFMAADESGDFYLSLPEFTALMRTISAFVKADKSGDNKVSIDEAKKAFLKDFAQVKSTMEKLLDELADSSLGPKAFYALYKKLVAAA